MDSGTGNICAMCISFTRRFRAIWHEFIIYLSSSISFLFPEYSDLHRHPIFTRFQDPPMKSPGVDHDWALPTAFKLSNSISFWKNLDPSTLASWLASGDRRETNKHMVGRLDRILVDKSRDYSQPADVKVLSVMAGTSDHIPISLKIQRKSQ